MIEITFNKEENRAIAMDGNKIIGECVFLETNDTWNIVHTEVDRSYQGQGIARKLVESVIENAKNEGKKLVADCSYAKRMIENN